ncbi:MAG: CHRD domain-containing protein [bacterium]
MRPTLIFLSAALLFAGACTGSDGQPTYAGSPSIALTNSASEAMASAGDTRTITAIVKDANQADVPATGVTWSSSAPGVATVSGTGASATVTAVDDGSAVITATSGSVRGTITVNVNRALDSMDISAPTSIVAPGSTVQLTVTAFDARHHELHGVSDIVFKSTNTNQVVVSNTGVVTGLFAFNTRSAAVTATVSKNGTSLTRSVIIGVGIEPTFNFAALMLAEYEKPIASAGSGVGVSYFTVNGSAIDYLVAWSVLSGPATAVHIHGPGTASDLAGILVDLTPAAQTTTTYGSARGTFTASDIKSLNGQPPISVDSLVSLIRAGAAYMDVHTAVYSGGEIRGQTFGPQ